MRAVVAFSLAFAALVPGSAAAATTPPLIAAGGRAVAGPASRPFHDLRSIRVASDGTDYLVTWDDDRSGTTQSYAERIDDAGQTLDAEPLLVAHAYATDFAVPVWKGDEYAVFTWLQYDMGHTRISPSGQITFGAKLPIGPALNGAWNGSTLALAVQGSDLFSTRLAILDSGLSVLKTVSLSQHNDTWPAAAVATDGVNFLVVWDVFAGTKHLIDEQIFDATGNARSPAQTLAEVAPAGVITRVTPSAVWNGSKYVVAWGAGKIDGATIAPDGTIDSRFELPVDAPQGGAVGLAWNGIDYLLIAGTEAVLMPVPGQVRQRFTIAYDARLQNTSAVGTNGKSFLVISGGRKYVVRSRRPSIVDAGAVTGAYLAQTRPVITANASTILGAWFESGAVYASRLDARGEPLDGSGVELGENATNLIAAASSANAHLVAWNTDPFHMTRIANDGARFDANGDPAPHWGYSVRPLAASDGTSFLVVYAASTSGVYSESVKAAVVPENGTEIRTTVIEPYLFVRSTFDSLVWTGQTYVFFSQHSLNAPCMNPSVCPLKLEPHLTLIDAAGRVTSDKVITVSGKALWNGDSFLVATFAGASVVTYRVAIDGTATRLGEIATSAMPSDPARLVRTAAGFLFLSGTHAIAIDSAGRPFSDQPLAGQTSFGDAVNAFGTAWMIYTYAWMPLPEISAATVSRVYLKQVGTRRRAVGRE